MRGWGSEMIHFIVRRISGAARRSSTPAVEPDVTVTFPISAASAHCCPTKIASKGTFAFKELKEMAHRYSRIKISVNPDKATADHFLLLKNWDGL